MYYIINQTNQIVAVDHALLDHLHISDSETFYKKIILEEVTVDLIDSHANITVDGKIYGLQASSHPLSGVLGEITLISLKAEEGEENALESSPLIDLEDEESALKHLLDEVDAEEEIKEEAPAEEEMISLDTIDLFDAPEETTQESTPIQESPQETASDAVMELFDVSETPSDTETTPETLTIQEEEGSQDDDLFELILPSDADNAIAEIAPEETGDISTPSAEAQRETEEESRPIYIDIETISKKIGISIDDYNLFLNEYIDTALTFEEALQSNNESEKTEALNTLLHLSNVLHLPYVGELLNRIQDAQESEKESAIEAFFSALGRLTTSQFDDGKVPQEEETVTLEEPVTEVLTIEPSENTEEETKEEESGLKPTIDLSDVKPIHFDFQLEEAAKDLSLPVELIEEFVNDFIVQAHEETEKMIDAYRKGDLETVQKIGHLLKGTSSNLRITPLADTLYEIQFNDDIDRVPELVRHYWGHFLSLENQIKLISK